MSLRQAPLPAGLRASPLVAGLGTQAGYRSERKACRCILRSAGNLPAYLVLIARRELRSLVQAKTASQTDEGPARFCFHLSAQCCSSRTSTTRLNTRMYREYTRSSCESSWHTKHAGKARLESPATTHDGGVSAQHCAQRAQQTCYWLRHDKKWQLRKEVASIEPHKHQPVVERDV